MANNRGKQKKKDNHELCGSCSLSCENDGDKAPWVVRATVGGGFMFSVWMSNL